jgi:aminoglycoside 3-N-acetyltransferase|tara:strand:- start:971 stop:1738 length:768 start_codon:yes stop_codon:yes gene_type:complete
MKNKEIDKIIDYLLSKKIKEKFIIVHSNLMPFRLNKNKANKFVDHFVKRLEKKFTIIMPAFKFNFEKKIWNYNSTKSEMGIMTEIFRKKYSLSRTIHPFHSISFYGKNSHLIRNKISKSSFGKNSFWSWACNRDDVLNLSLCLGIDGGATFIHYVEELLKVPYRKFIKLKFSLFGKNDKKINFSFTYFGIKNFKKSLIINDWKLVEKNLLRLKIMKKRRVGDYFFCHMNTKQVTQFLYKKVRKNPYYMVVKKPIH